MTHIAGHPPTIDESFIAMSPLYRMAGYLELEDNEQTMKKGQKPFRLFFINNTGYEFKKGEKVGFHLALIPLHSDNPALKNLKAGWAAIAYDLVPYKQHQAVERAVMGTTGKIEHASVQYIEDCAKERNGLERTILEQTARYMRSPSFKTLYDHYKGNGNIPGWIRQNVADLTTMESKIIGCSNRSSSGNEVLIRDFPASLEKLLENEKEEKKEMKRKKA